MNLCMVLHDMFIQYTYYSFRAFCYCFRNVPDSTASNCVHQSPILLDSPRYTSTPAVIRTKRSHQELDTKESQYDSDDDFEMCSVNLACTRCIHGTTITGITMLTFRWMKSLVERLKMTYITSKIYTCVCAWKVYTVYRMMGFTNKLNDDTIVSSDSERFNTLYIYEMIAIYTAYNIHPVSLMIYILMRLM